MTFVVFRMIASNLDAPDRLAAHAIGIAVGTLVGLHANDRLSSGQSAVQVFAHRTRPGLGQGEPAVADRVDPG